MTDQVKTKFSELYPRCQRILMPIVWILLMFYIPMCIVFDIYYSIEHRHAGMIFLYSFGNICMIVFSTFNCAMFQPPYEREIDDYPKVIWFYIFWFFTCFSAKIVTIIIFTLNEQGKIDIGLDPDSFGISLINWLVTWSPGSVPVAFTMIFFLISFPFVMCMFICSVYKLEYTYPEMIQIENTSPVRDFRPVHDSSNSENTSPVRDFRPVHDSSNSDIIFCQTDCVSVKSEQSTSSYTIQITDI